MENDEINYDHLMEKALKYVVVEALKVAAEDGLSNKNHFYITFKTNHPDVRMDTALLNQYPEDMTIVLQHQFANLLVSEKYFEVDLSFNDIPHTLRVPYEAITYFADPYARFALSFAFDGAVSEGHKETSTAAQASNGGADIVSIDAFRKK